MPDLDIAMPADSAEAYWLLRHAFTRPVPTLFLEFHGSDVPFWNDLLVRTVGAMFPAHEHERFVAERPTGSSRHLAKYDPKTRQITHVSTCFGTHHLQFAYGDDNILWTSGGGDVVGWLDTNLFLETGDAAAAQGWEASIAISPENVAYTAGFTVPSQPVIRHRHAIDDVEPVTGGQPYGCSGCDPGSST